jgi:hypothetical protein
MTRSYGSPAHRRPVTLTRQQQRLIYGRLEEPSGRRSTAVFWLWLACFLAALILAGAVGS